MKRLNSIIQGFWAALRKIHRPDATERLVIDDFVIRKGGVDVVSKDKFEDWAKQVLEKVSGLQFEVVETLQNEDGSRVAARWRVTGKKQPSAGDQG